MIGSVSSARCRACSVRREACDPSVVITSPNGPAHHARAGLLVLVSLLALPEYLHVGSAADSGRTSARVLGLFGLAPFAVLGPRAAIAHMAIHPELARTSRAAWIVCLSIGSGLAVLVHVLATWDLHRR